MEKIEQINNILNSIISLNKECATRDRDWCCSRLSENPVNIVETDKVKVVFNDRGECEVQRKQNDNPVILRDENNKIYRLHGEWHCIEPELLRLAGFEAEAAELLADDTNSYYD